MLANAAAKAARADAGGLDRYVAPTGQQWPRLSVQTHRILWSNSSYVQSQALYPLGLPIGDREHYPPRSAHGRFLASDPAWNCLAVTR